MAARRLLILLLVLLGISTLAAALAPVQSSRDKTAETTTTEATQAEEPPETVPGEAPPGDTGGLFKATIDAGSKKIAVIRLYAGEELQLAVASKAPDQVAIPKLGQIEPVSKFRAAKFDLFLDAPGDYTVRLVDANRLVGRLEVTPGARPEKGRKRGNAQPGQR